VSGHGTLRTVGLAGSAWGLALLTRGDDIWAAVDGRPPNRTERAVVDLLGARHLLQGSAQILAPRLTRSPAVLVDVIHTASMVGVAVWSPRYRKVALVTAAVATSGAILDHAARRRSRRADDASRGRS
jgi:nucleoside-diphosphate-sugar epimerase